MIYLIVANVTEYKFIEVVHQNMLEKALKLIVTIEFVDFCLQMIYQIYKSKNIKEFLESINEIDDKVIWRFNPSLRLSLYFSG